MLEAQNLDNEMHIIRQTQILQADVLDKRHAHTQTNSIAEGQAIEAIEATGANEAIDAIEATVSTVAIEASHQSPPLDPHQASFVCLFASAVFSDSGESFSFFAINFSQDNFSTRTPSILSSRLGLLHPVVSLGVVGI